MSNPTNPFSWQMPQNTDLVTDLPADFEVFGQAVATSMADLLGGTTGQVLAKNTNTNMDFVWTTPNVGDITEVAAGTGISVASGTGPIPTVTNTMATAIDAKGDLVVGTAADTFSRLAVGATNNHVLTVDSAQATGMKWAAVTATAANNSTAFVATQESTTSTSYTALTTALATTVTTGTRALVIITAEIELALNAARGYMSYAVSGATTIASSDAFSINIKTNADQTIDAHSYAYIVTGLTAGSNTFTTQYRSGQGATVYFTNRRISVIDMGS